MKTTFRVSGKLGKATAVDDIRAILEKTFHQMYKGILLRGLVERHG